MTTRQKFRLRRFERRLHGTVKKIAKKELPYSEGLSELFSATQREAERYAHLLD